MKRKETNPYTLILGGVKWETRFVWTNLFFSLLAAPQFRPNWIRWKINKAWWWKNTPLAYQAIYGYFTFFNFLTYLSILRQLFKFSIDSKKYPFQHMINCEIPRSNFNSFRNFCTFSIPFRSFRSQGHNWQFFLYHLLCFLFLLLITIYCILLFVFNHLFVYDFFYQNSRLL